MRVLILRLSALGDVVTATPAATLLKQQIPGVRVVWAVERPFADALRGNPDIDELLVLPRSREWRRWVTRGQLGAAAAALRETLDGLRARPFDVVLDCQGLIKSALYAAAARADRKIMPADAGERVTPVFTDIVPRETDPRHISTMYTHLLAPLGVRTGDPMKLRMTMPIGQPERASAIQRLAAAGLGPGSFVACAPGTTRPQKHWNPRHWPPLLADLHARLGLPAVLLGGPAERPLADAIVAATTTPLLDLTGETSLQETAAVFEAARVAVSVDTGPMHMAVAVGCPTVAAFGSTSPRLFGDAPYVCLHRRFACSPCNRRPICRHYDCLTAIRPADMSRAVDEVIAQGR